MVKYKEITQKLREYEAQKERIYEVMRTEGLNCDPQLALTLIKEAGVLYDAIQGRKAEERATKADEKRFGLVCQLLDEFNGVKKAAKKGIDALLG